MKKLTQILGVIASFLFLISVLFKWQHWPGANMGFTVSIALFALGYAPLFYMERNKLSQDKTQKIVNLMSLLAMILLSVTFLFKIMHWPGAAWGIYVGNLVLLVMVPVLFINSSKENDPARKLNFFNEAILLVYMLAFSLYIWLVLNHPAINP